MTALHCTSAPSTHPSTTTILLPPPNPDHNKHISSLASIFKSLTFQLRIPPTSATVVHMSSIRFGRRSKSWSSSPVELYEIFDLCHNSTTADIVEREELPSTRFAMNIPNGVQDLKGLRNALAEDGIEITAKDDVLCISGYPPRKDYNYQREIRAAVAKYRRGSKSFS